MSKCEIICFREKFSEFKKISSNTVANLPADSSDEFAICLARNSNGELGFNRAPEAAKTNIRLTEGCYRLNFDRNEIVSPSHPRWAGEAVLPMLFRAKDERFEKAVNDYVKYKLELQRHNIRSRHSPSSPPAPCLLTNFMTSGGRSISRDVYTFMMESCHYVILAHLGGEYGNGTMNAFSKNLDFFFDELSFFSSNECHVVFVDNSSNLPVQ